MAVVTVDKSSYTVSEPLYQWDLNQVLEIRGLSLPKIPAVHFANEAMSRAIVRQATMDAAGVVRVDIPNSLLQKPYKLTAWVCIYQGETFESLYQLVIPVKARNQPADYTIEGDEEIYSFIELENAVANAMAEVGKAEDSYLAAAKKYDDAKAILDGTSEEYSKGLEELDEVRELAEDMEAMINTEYAVKPKGTDVTLTAAGWTGAGSRWYHAISNDAITAETKIDVTAGADALEAMVAMGVTALYAENNGGTAQVVAVGKQPEADFAVQLTFTEVGSV